MSALQQSVTFPEGKHMVYKIIGSLLLAGAGGYLAMMLSRFERRRLLVLDGYLSLIRCIKGQIDCFSMPLEDILAGIDPSVLSACRGEDAPDERYPSPRSVPSLPRLLDDSRSYLGRESERLLSSFAGELGRTHRAEQVSRCDYYLSALGEERRRLADALPGRLRTGSTLCITCALAMAVLLW